VKHHVHRVLTKFIIILLSFLLFFPTTHLLCRLSQIVSPFYNIHNSKYLTFADQIDVEQSSGPAIQIDAIPSSSSDGDRWGKDFPYTPEEFEKLKQEVFNSKRPRKSKQDFFDHLILLHAQYDAPSEVSENATDKEKEANRIRRLQSPNTRHRFVFSTWPRDPKGKPITPGNSKLGKMAANEIQHWGATLFNFYYVRRMPDFGGLQTTSTGSKLAAWMKANGEDYAKDELEFAEEEEDPEEIFPCDIAKLVDTIEMRERTGISRMLRPSDRKGKGKGKEFSRPVGIFFWRYPHLV
jgi:hypothetical protein